MAYRTGRRWARKDSHPVRVPSVWRLLQEAASGSHYGLLLESTWVSRKVGGTNRITIQSCNKECDVTASRQYYAVDQTSRNEDV